MNKFINSIKIFSAKDFTVIAFYLFLIVLNLIFQNRVPDWGLLILSEIGLISFVILSAYFHQKYNNLFWRTVHLWYPVPYIFITFKQLYAMVHPIHPTDYDELLIKIDRFIFGADPTVVLFNIAHPVLTEFLQVVYTSFYFLPIILGINLVRRKKYLEFDYAVFMVVHAFFLSYFGYFSLPAIGPRFTLHNFYTINSELPGLLVTNFLRDFINWGESITSTMKDAAKFVQRDVFPSGHTQITIITMYLSFKLKSETKYFLLVTGLLLIFSTVYLRYHYVVDLLAGGVFALLTIYSGKIIYKRWNKFINKPCSELI